MNIVIFSKDRPCQLELFLRSMVEFYSTYETDNMTILYTYSNDQFKEGYDKLIDMYSNFKFLKETDFKKDLISCIDTKIPYSVFFVDDIIFKREIDIEASKEFQMFTQNTNICCLSLRLHPDLDYCYPADVKMSRPTDLDENNIWDWRGKPGDFGYPMSLDGHIFRTDQILFHIFSLNYRNPNSLEGLMAMNPLPIFKMICYNDSVIINNAINIVQTNNPNRHGDISAVYLNDQFLNGNRIKLDTFKKIKNKSFHQVLDVEFEKII